MLGKQIVEVQEFTLFCILVCKMASFLPDCKHCFCYIISTSFSSFFLHETMKNHLSTCGVSFSSMNAARQHLRVGVYTHIRIELKVEALALQKREENIHHNQ